MAQELTVRDNEIIEKATAIFDAWPRTKIIFGNGVIRQTGKIAAQYGKNALIIIGGNSVKKNHTLDLLLMTLDAAKVKAQIFEGVEPNPSHDTIKAIAKMYKDGKFDVAIALGGGSPLDATKAALILVALNENDLGPYFGVGIVSKKLNRITPCICIPTTSGTSAEITRYANITVKELDVKKLISDIVIHPHYAIVDPLLTISCPKDLTTTVGLDTMTHAFEGFLNTMQDEGNDDINERALLCLEIVFRWLKVAVDEPENKDARKMMAIASLLGGTVIGGERFKGTGGPHMNSFSWHETIPHGKSTGITLPYYIVYYAKNPIVAKKLMKVAPFLNIAKEGNIGLNFAKAMLSWYKSMGYPTSLGEIPEWKVSYLDKALSDAGQNEMKLKAMPNPVSLDKVNDILKPIIEAAITGDLSKI